MQRMEEDKPAPQARRSPQKQHTSRRGPKAQRSPQKVLKKRETTTGSDDRVFISPTIDTIMVSHDTRQLDTKQVSTEVHTVYGFVYQLIVEILLHVGSSQKSAFEQGKTILLTIRHHLEAGLLAYLRAAALTTTLTEVRTEFIQFRGHSIYIEPYLARVINCFMPIDGCVQLVWNDVVIKLTKAINGLNNILLTLKSSSLTDEQIRTVGLIASQGMGNEIITQLLSVTKSSEVYFFEPDAQAFRYLYPQKTVKKQELKEWKLDISPMLFQPVTGNYNAHYVVYEIKVRSRKFATRVTSASIQFHTRPPVEFAHILTETCCCFDYSIIYEHELLAPQWAREMVTDMLPQIINAPQGPVHNAPSRAMSPVQKIEQIPTVYVKGNEPEKKTYEFTEVPAHIKDARVQLTLQQARKLAALRCTFDDSYYKITPPAEQQAKQQVELYMQELGYFLPPEGNVGKA